MVTLTTTDMTEGYPGLQVGDVGELSILEILQRVCRIIGEDEPDVAVANTEAIYKKLLTFSNETIEELIRRVDWPILADYFDITGTGDNDTFNSAVGFDRLAKGNAVVIVGELDSGGDPVDGDAIRGTLSTSEWASLTPVEGTPRLFRQQNTFFSFWPYPDTETSIRIYYQSNLWCSNGTDAWVDDTDTPLVPSELVIMGMVWRFKRYIGTDFSDQMAEYEAALADYGASEGRVRR